MTPLKPYLVRAVYDWLVDNDMTPYLLVDANQVGVEVPQSFVKDGKIILNIRPQAVQDLALEEHAVIFTARFSGKPVNIYVPMVAVLALYAQENGRGMVFDQEDDGPPPEEPPEKEPPPKKPFLRVVK
jgi:stringent starvation protein B